MNRDEVFKHVAELHSITTQIKKTVDELQMLTKSLSDYRFESGIYEVPIDVSREITQILYLTECVENEVLAVDVKIQCVESKAKKSDHRKHIMSRFSTTV